MVLLRIHHPHIVTLVSSFETPQDIFLVMDLMSGGGLPEFTIAHGPFQDKKAGVIFSQIGGALASLHVHSIIHRDVKPEDIKHKLVCRRISVYTKHTHNPFACIFMV